MWRLVWASFLPPLQAFTLGPSTFVGSLLSYPITAFIPSSSFECLPPVALYIPYIRSLLRVIHSALRDIGILAMLLHFYLPLLSQYFIIYFPHIGFLQIHFFTTTWFLALLLLPVYISRISLLLVLSKLFVAGSFNTQVREKHLSMGRQILIWSTIFSF
jgi:hypothetical protein